jgi:hypothetical protein
MRHDPDLHHDHPGPKGDRGAEARGARAPVVLIAAALALVGLVGLVGAGTPIGAATGSGSHPTPATLAAAIGAASPSPLIATGVATRTTRGHASVNPDCTFNGVTDIVPNVTPGSAIAIVCSGWTADETIAAGEISPLFFQSGSDSDIDPDIQTFTSDGSGDLHATFTVPNPFRAPNPAAVCPPTAAQVAQGFLRCGLVLADQSANGAVVALDYAAQPAPAPVVNGSAVGMAATPDGGGYWIAWSNGNVTVHGDAQSYGNATTFHLNQPIAHIVSTSDGKGYWLVASDGGTFAFGDAGFFGSMGGVPLNKPVVDIAPTKDDKGYWLVASDGGIFSFGDAIFRGSMGAATLNKPVVGIAADDASGGYWLVASDGGIFAFDAPFFGSTGNLMLNQPVNGMAVTVTDRGYLFVASDGGIFAFGDAAFHGSTGSLTLNKPIVGMATDPVGGGYWLVGSDGGIFAFAAPFYGAG